MTNNLKIVHMKRLLIIALAAIALVSCSSQKRILYLQDLNTSAVDKIADTYQIRFKPLDRITLIVNSQRPELAAPFNTSTSFNSLTGIPIDGRGITTSTNAALQVLTIDQNGMLDLPIIGQVYCTGKTRQEVSEEIAAKIIESGYLTDPAVNIQFADLFISVIGEVNRPGRYNISNDRISLLDALALAGDLTVFGQRNDVTVIREENGQRTSAQLDLTSADLLASPYFYLQQNDLVYVRPNKYKAKAGEVDPNRSLYISLTSIAITVATLIVTLTK